MTDERVAAALRAVRVRRGWRQQDVADRAGVSRALVSLIERGHAGRVAVDAIRRVAGVLEIRIDLVPRWRGGELDRLLNAAHSSLEEAITRWLTRLGGWAVAPEVSFAIQGERGWIDLLAWHAASRTVLVVEIKTDIVDVQQLIGVVDRKVRLAPRIARERSWSPATVGVWVAVANSSTNRRRVAAHTNVLRAAFPADVRMLRGWLGAPAGRLAAMSFVSYATPGSAKSRFVSRKRVRRPREARSERAAGVGASGSLHESGRRAG